MGEKLNGKAGSICLRCGRGGNSCEIDVGTTQLQALDDVGSRGARPAEVYPLASGLTVKLVQSEPKLVVSNKKEMLWRQ